MIVSYVMMAAAVLILVTLGRAEGLHAAVSAELQARRQAELKSVGLSIVKEISDRIAALESRGFTTDRTGCEVAPCEPIALPDHEVFVYWKSDHTHEWLRWGVRDMESRLSIDLASDEVLSRVPGISEAMIGSLRRAQTSSYPVRSPEALRRLRYWESVDISTLGEYLSLTPAESINLNTCSGRVLEALGVSKRCRDSILQFRAGPNGVRGDADDGVFRGLAEVPVRLSRIDGNKETKQEVARWISSGLWDVRSRHFEFRVRIVDRLTNEHYEIRALVGSDGLTHQWSEGPVV